jgi:hypothetical protein
MLNMRTILHFIRYAALLALVAGTPAFAQTLENESQGSATFRGGPGPVRLKVMATTSASRGRLGGEVRNELIKKASTSKSIKDIREEGRDMRQDMRENRQEVMGQMRDDRKETMEKLRGIKGSSTEAMKAERKEMRQSMRMNELAMRMSLIVRQLNVRIDVLTKINDKVVTRIAKIATQKVDVTKANNLEKIAADNLKKATDAVNALASYKPATSTVQTGTSTEITLEKPRIYAQNAIEAIKTAQKSIRDVIVELEKSSKGLKPERKEKHEDEPAEHTSTTTASSTTP